MSLELHKVRVRTALKPRREPYWGDRIAQGCYLGFRKIDEQRASWIARLRLDDGRHVYKALGPLTDAFDHARALDAAERWFKNRDAGIVDEVTTVADACREYVNDRRREKGEATARDAEGRFERTVYKNPFGGVALAKVRTSRIEEWRNGLGLSKGTANRTLIALKAALTLSVKQRRVPMELAREWGDVRPYKNASKRRDLFLDQKQRRALHAATEGALRDLVEGAMLTGARAGELVNATRSQFDARTQSMSFTGKTGPRTVPLSGAAVALFSRLAEGKAPGDRLLVRPDGKPWAHSDWDELVRAAATAAELPAGTCLYTLRHSFITQAITDGLSTLDVARLVGTSVMMIEKHYGQFVKGAVRNRLAKVKIL